MDEEGGFSRILKSDDFKKTLLSFFLTALVGGGLTLFYQTLAAARAEREQLRLAEIRAASDVFTDVSKSLDKRLYRTRRLLWALTSDTIAGETESRRRLYDDAIQDWNENLNRTYALTERYFGPALRNSLESQIAEEFRCFSQQLGTKGADLGRLKKALDVFNPMIYQFNVEMLRRIQSGNVGVMRDEGDAPRLPAVNACLAQFQAGHKPGGR